MNDLSFQKSPDKSQISYFLLCNYIGLFIPVARLQSDRLLKHAQSLQLAGEWWQKPYYFTWPSITRLENTLLLSHVLALEFWEDESPPMRKDSNRLIQL